MDMSDEFLSKKEELRVYKIKLENTIRTLDENNHDDSEIEVLKKRVKVYSKGIERLEEELSRN